MSPSKPGLDFPNVVSVSTRGGGFGKISYQVYLALAGVFGVGVLGAARSICDDGVENIAENLKHCEGEVKAELPCVLGGVTFVYVWEGCVRGELVSAGTHGTGVPGVPVLICGEGWIVMAENRAEATGMGEPNSHG